MTSKFVGSTGTTVYGGYFSEEYLQDLVGRSGAEIFNKMRRGDGQMGMVMRAIKNPIRSAKFCHEAATDDERDVEIARFLDWVWFENPYVSFRQLLNEALTFLDFGFSIHEKIFTTIDHPEFGLSTILAGLGFRKQTTIERWVIDGKRGLTGVDQVAFGDTVPAGSQNVFIPVENLLIFTNDQEGDNYEGVSILRNSYGPWFRKNLYLKLVGIGIEKASIGTPIGKYPKGAEDEHRDGFIAMLGDFSVHEKSFIACPESYSVEVVKIPFDSEKVMAAITYEDGQMAKSTLFQFLELGQNGNGGSYALGADQSDLALSAIQYVGDFICEKMNEINRQLIAWNFGDVEKLPCAKCSGINQKAGVDLANVINGFVEKGVVRVDDTLEEHVRKTYNLPKFEMSREEEREARRKQAEEAQRAGLERESQEDEIEGPGQKEEREGSGGGKKETPDSEDDEPEDPQVKPSEKKDRGLSEKNERGLVKLEEPTKWSPWRELTEYEEGINFSEIKADYDSEALKLSRVMRNRINVMIEKALADCERIMRQNPGSRARAVEAQLSVNAAQYRKALQFAMGSLVAIGSKQAVKELKMKVGPEMADPDLKAFKKDIEFLPPHVKEGLLAQAAQQAESQADQIKKIVAFGAMSGDEYRQDDRQILADLEAKLDAMVESGQLDSAANTIAAQAINRGRNAFFFDKTNLKQIQAFQYSAIIDSRTSDICLSLDGKIFRPGDQNDALRPPNHHRCRSILIPITINEEKPKYTGLDIDPTNPSLVQAYKDRGKPLPDLATIKKQRNL